MEKRSRQWRRRQAARVFKARLKRCSATFTFVSLGREGHIYHPHWFELAKEHWMQAYRTTGTPCSCWMCRGKRYDRLEAKRATQKSIDEENM